MTQMVGSRGAWLPVIVLQQTPSACVLQLIEPRQLGAQLVSQDGNLLNEHAAVHHTQLLRTSPVELLRFCRNGKRESQESPSEVTVHALVHRVGCDHCSVRVPPGYTALRLLRASRIAGYLGGIFGLKAIPIRCSGYNCPRGRHRNELTSGREDHLQC